MRKSMALLVCGTLLGCGGDQHEAVTPYAQGQALLIGPDKGGTQARLDEVCEGGAERAHEDCLTAMHACGSSDYADVVLDEGHGVLDVICYPGNATVQDIGSDPVDTATAGNHTVLVFDDLDDGVDVSGDVSLTGNGAVVYGHGADVSVIGGDLNVDKNNAIVRGVRIEGDVTISKNNAQFAFCEIGGNLTIAGNNATLAECVVHGQVIIDGNNAVFVRNELASNSTLSGKNLSCNANVAFDDTESSDAASPTPADAADSATTAVVCSG
jgi:carbonic anhydrase/acetyltransferase-like protein (isoleucine patch superfamily)